MTRRILANHAHVFEESVRAHATVDRLLELMDRCGIEQAVCFAPFPGQMASDQDARNRWLAREIVSQDRLYGFGTVDFRQPNIAEQVKEIYGLGLKGIKIHPAHQKVNVLSPESFEMYHAAAEYGLFLSFHTGLHWHRLKDYDALMFDEIAYQLPQLKFSMEHVGGYSFFPEALAVIVNNIRTGHVYGGLTSVFTTHVSRAFRLSQERLDELVAQAGAGRLMFGIDFPYNQVAETKVGIETIENMQVTEEEKDLMLGGTLRQALGIQ